MNARSAGLLPLGAFLFGVSPGGAGEVVRTEYHDVDVSVVMGGLRHPWGMAFLPNGDLLITERGGRLLSIRAEEGISREIAGLPEIEEIGQGGLMGIALHPDFAAQPWVYLAHAASGPGGAGTEVIRGRLEAMALRDVETIFRALPKARGGRHFGSRLVFAPDGTLFISLGERGESDAAQDLRDHRGSLIRINDDGSVPADNPFSDHPDTRPEIYAYGNRNMQGMALNPDTATVWTHEHGPQGGDEINIMRPGANYGWPVITYGVNYVIGTRIGEGTHKAGMEQPIHHWVPSIAPSGMTFYTGDRLPDWRGDLFVGSLKFGLLVRLAVDGERITGEERLLNNRYGRIRDVTQGPDGCLYLLTDSPNGRLLKIAPAQAGR